MILCSRLVKGETPIKHLAITALGLLLLSGCGEKKPSQPDPAPAESATNSPVDVRMDAVPVPGVPVEDAAPDNQPTTGSAETTAVASRPAATPRPDVGYAGLESNFTSIELALLPYVDADSSTRIPQEVGDQVVQRTRQFIFDLDAAKSVDKDVRGDIRDRLTDVFAGVQEMTEKGDDARYSHLQVILKNNLEGIRGDMLKINPSVRN